MSWADLRSDVADEFGQLAPPLWEQLANAAWLIEQRRKRAWGAAAWRFSPVRRLKGRAAQRRHYQRHRHDETWRAKSRAQCKAYRARRALDPVRSAEAKAKRRAAYAREWKAVKSDPKRYAKKLAWTRAWRARQKVRCAA